LPGTYYEAYGLTEGFFTVLDKYDYEKKSESVGCPTPFSDIKIVDNQRKELPAGEVGEIIGRSPLAMAGYYKQPELTRQTIINGWIYSGDLGFTDDEGFLHLVDRKKDMIISGGINVYPRDIEEVLIQHSSVREVAVYGVPSEKWGGNTGCGSDFAAGSCSLPPRTPGMGKRASGGTLSESKRSRHSR
jgi:long-chain acyl-CoA synthetase